jgi:hypothetical protein
MAAGLASSPYANLNRMATAISSVHAIYQAGIVPGIAAHMGDFADDHAFDAKLKRWHTFSTPFGARSENGM